jgi:hypothetical protein
MSQKVPMKDEQWRELAKRSPRMNDFKLGPAPAPVPCDTYSERWLKLVWMEAYCSMLQFKLDYTVLSPAQFDQDAFLSISINSYDQKKEAYR